MRILIAAAVLLAGAQEKDLRKVFREEFVDIAPGKFTRGSSTEFAHEVQIRTAFRIAKYEVPQNLWEAVMGGNPSKWKGKRNSVEMLSFQDALEFCAKATALMRQAKLIEETQVIRLPSEAEWEYAARAGTTTKYSFGDDPKDLDAYAWHTGNAEGYDPPVGAKKPNPWKLYDVHGYLWEWCADVWHDTYEHAPKDGSAWTVDGNQGSRVIRGGSWKDKAEALTSDHRRGVPATTKDDAVGLRCVLSEKK
jgi:formylglycine-generating enzyme required for sulfatase activity